MNRLHIERLDLNRNDNEYPQTMRITLRINDHIDWGILCDALEATRLRYPYLCVKVGTVRDADGSVHYVYEENREPWMLSIGRRPLCLFGNESNDHLLAFAWWDNCIALDFSHVLIDCDSAYCLLRTLLHEYCCRRYDACLSREGVWQAGDVIDEADWTAPATRPCPPLLQQEQLPELARTVNLATEAVSPIAERKEVVQIRIAEDQMMQCVRDCGATPATLLSQLLSRAIARLHPDCAPSVPTVCVAANLHNALGEASSCLLCYAGKTNLGAAERYVREMVTETDSPYMMVVEVCAAAGLFTLSFIHRFTDDAYLDAFLDELRGQKLTPEIANRHPLLLAPIADYRQQHL